MKNQESKTQGLFSGFFRRWWYPEQPQPDPDQPSVPRNPPSGDFLDNMLALHNQARGSRGALTLNTILVAAAQKHAEWMYKYKKMSHVGAGGSTFWDRIKAEGYQPRTGGENVAMGYPTTEAVFSGWMKSPGHHANIMNSSFKQCGFGVAGDSSKYWCAVFATPMYGASALDLPFQELELQECFPDGLIFDGDI